MDNIFEELKGKKEALIGKVSKAHEFGWIDETRYKEIIDKINNDILTIGVIGQMKCGKSTFLNSFVFEDEVLPSATTPMTAALSVITYGESKKIVAEFYNEDEWEEMKAQASRNLDEVSGNTLQESKVKAAKELVEKSTKLGSSINDLLNKGKQEDSFEHLIEYVGAEGKYVAITKSVVIYYPKEYLKGVEIVDTPGFNDPIVSREERTNEFLKKADVVIMMLYAGRPFDSTDRDIIFTNVRQCGIGKVIIGINKYDIPYENGETEDEIKEYVKSELKKACKLCDDSTLVEILDETEPIPISAEMALLSELPMAKINSEEHLDFSWKRSCDTFEISNQKEMRDKSHITDLINAVKLLLEKEKDEILFKKPINAILAAGHEKKDAIEKSLRESEILLSNLSKPNDELEECLDNLNRAKRRLDNKIEALDDDMNDKFKNLVRTGKNNLEDIVDASCNRMESIINNWSKVKSVDVIKPDLEKETQRLMTRDIKRAIEEMSSSAERNTKIAVQDFMTEAEEILMKYLPEVDSDDVVRSVSSKIDLEIQNYDLFSYGGGDAQNKNGIYGALANGAIMVLGGAVGIGIKEGLKAGYHAITHEKKREELLGHLMELRNMDMTPYLDTVFSRKNELIGIIKKAFITDLVEPIEEQVQEILSNTKQREDEKKKTEETVSNLHGELAKVSQELDELS
ncbi:MAG: dynamin family protein [Bacteroidaceae bacterium]|nr:dynamin family protein [Bacteroidaceae bacterium]